MRTRSSLAALALTLSACAPFTVIVQPRTHLVTVSNACYTTATVFIDGRNVGTVPGAGGVRSFEVTEGRHTINVDNDYIGDTPIDVYRNVHWHGGQCIF